MRVSRSLALGIMGFLSAVAVASCGSPAHAQPVDVRHNWYGKNIMIDQNCVMESVDGQGNLTAIYNLNHAIIAYKDSDKIKIRWRNFENITTVKNMPPVDVDRFMRKVVHCGGKENK